VEQKILFKISSRERPEMFFTALNSIVDNLADTENYFIQCSFDLNDATMFNETVVAALKEYKNLTYYFGVNNSKIEAINANLDKLPEFDILVFHSDDFIATEFGFDNIIRENYQDGFKGFLHLPDGFQGKNLITYPIMHQSLIKRFGYIYNPEYYSVYPDDEMTAVAKLLKLYRYDERLVVKHLHYRWNLSSKDELYKRNDNPEVYAKDKEVFIKRKLNNFDL